LHAFAGARGFALAEMGFMGDDINDLPAMALAGWSAAPSSAHDSVKARVDFVTQRTGGNGAVREALDHLLAGRAVP